VGKNLEINEIDTIENCVTSIGDAEVEVVKDINVTLTGFEVQDKNLAWYVLGGLGIVLIC